MHVKALRMLPSMKGAKKALDVIVIVLWRFVLKLYIRSSKRRDVNTLKLRGQKNPRCIAKQRRD